LKLAKNFPFLSSPQNNQASELLDQLAQTPDCDIDPALWAKFEPFLATHSAREAISAAARAVGFSQRPRDLNGLIEAMMWDADEEQLTVDADIFSREVAR
jgi:hypothetical protein